MASVTRSPGTCVNDAANGDVSWATPENAEVDGGGTATCAIDPGQESQWLMAKDFDFSPVGGIGALPNGGRILGLEVNYDSDANVVSTIQEIGVQFAQGGVFGGAIKTFGLALWVLGFLTRTAGADDDLFGLAWTRETFNDPDFAVGIRVENAGILSASALIDHIQLTVHYDTPKISTGAI